MSGNNIENPADVLNVIESSLDLTGKGSKQIILDYLKVRYGMNADLIVQYRDEFENYLRETIGDSAEVIISKINDGLCKSSSDKQQARRTPEVANFLICDSCFWCASVLKENYESKCQACGRQITSAIPVMHDEQFAVDVDKKRGITVSFRSIR
ncbi:MAG: hypothetical protein ACREAY_05905 [Nitrososphaera sp.]|uniref:hypothetical protein n=1 Tax=Nitrososphaera sp. TaxID=1971748 RepID=UPI003D6EF4B7